jgi:hypothetical protein
MEAPMEPLPKEIMVDLIQTPSGRSVTIPRDFILEGPTVIMRQERDGLITIFPGTDHGREVVWREFDLFSD